MSDREVTESVAEESKNTADYIRGLQELESGGSGAKLVPTQAKTGVSLKTKGPTQLRQIQQELEAFTGEWGANIVY